MSNRESLDKDNRKKESNSNKGLEFKNRKNKDKNAKD
jgi:hypothetical protein